MYIYLSVRWKFDIFYLIYFLWDDNIPNRFISHSVENKRYFRAFAWGNACIKSLLIPSTAPVFSNWGLQPQQNLVSQNYNSHAPVIIPNNKVRPYAATHHFTSLTSPPSCPSYPRKISEYQRHCGYNWFALMNIYHMIDKKKNTFAISCFSYILRVKLNLKSVSQALK